jgi:2-deoxy-D-gluconate 3-dehydrogenase
VTGGTRGIGAKIALALSKAGADLILVQRNTSNTSTRDEIVKAGGKADIVVADLADKESVEKLIPHVTQDLGRSLDIVVNCGVYRLLYPSISSSAIPPFSPSSRLSWT